MMGYQLPTAVHICPFDSATVALDLKADRYFLLSGHLHEALHAALYGLHLTEQHLPYAAKLMERGILQTWNGETRTKLKPEGPTFPQTLANPPLAKPGWTFPFTFLRLLAAIIEVKRRPLNDILTELDLMKRRVTPNDVTSSGRVVLLSRLFAAMKLANVLMGADHLCLPRSICTMRILLARGFPAQLVMAVTERPFRAHSWVQLDQFILTDTPDHIVAFKPIFSL